VGHGMQYVKDIDLDRSYSFVTQSNSSGIAIRHIALDTNARNPQGSFSNEKMKWLEKELKAAAKNKQLVIVSSHHKPIDIFDNGNRLVRLLKKHPHVIAHLVAHWHQNDIQARPGKHAKNGYWEIETDSMVKWPQQLRVLEISVDKKMGLGVIKSTMLNHQSANPYAVSERGRFLTYLEGYLKGGEQKLIRREGEAEDRNTLLYFKLPKNFF
jgi:3',5'-cyclic AMP phosphodiesterase CpdA